MNPYIAWTQDDVADFISEHLGPHSKDHSKTLEAVEAYLEKKSDAADPMGLSKRSLFGGRYDGKYFSDPSNGDEVTQLLDELGRELSAKGMFKDQLDDERLTALLHSLPNQLLALEKALPYDFPGDWREPRFDVKYDMKEQQAMWQRGGRSFNCPDGWSRLSLNAKKTLPKNVDIDTMFAQWSVAYLGTHAPSLDNMAELGLITPPGNVGAPSGTSDVDASKSIEYAIMNPLCSGAYTFADIKHISKGSKDIFAYFAYELRVRPDGYRTNPTTCPPFGNTLRDWPQGEVPYDLKEPDLRWLIANPSSDLVVTGVMFKLTTTRPQDIVSERYKENKAYFEQRKQKLRMQGISPEKARWEWFCAKKEPGPAGATESKDWKQYEPAVSEQIEKAYQLGLEAHYCGPLPAAQRRGRSAAAPSAPPPGTYMIYFDRETCHKTTRKPIKLGHYQCRIDEKEGQREGGPRSRPVRRIDGTAARGKKGSEVPPEFWERRPAAGYPREGSAAAVTPTKRKQGA